MGKDEDLKALYEKARQLGVPFPKPGKYKKFSSTAHEVTLDVFRAMASRLGYKMQDALTEAMDCWIEMRGNNSKK